MGCSTCSKIRCTLVSKVSGIKSEFITGMCGDGTGCELRNARGNRETFEFGNNFRTLLPYLRMVIRIAVARLRGQNPATQIKDIYV